MISSGHEIDGFCRHCGYDLLLYFNRKLVCVRCGAPVRTDPSVAGRHGSDEAPSPSRKSQ
jgi:hypothetical protein